MHDMYRYYNFNLGNPGEAVLVCIYTDPLIGNFNPLADDSRAAESVSIVYCFLLSVRAVTSSGKIYSYIIF